jgi:hypothetical protein
VAKKKSIRTEAEKPDEDNPLVQELNRDDELSTQADIKDALLEVLDEIDKGFTDQWSRSNDQMDYWDIYNCVLGPNQFYTGNSKIFVPIVHNAVNARVTRFTNQLFPQSGRNVECTTEDGSIPHALIALLEHYVKKSRLRTKIAPALMRNGDVEGQYNIYVNWVENKRYVVQKVKKQPEVDGTPMPGETIDDIEEETLTHQYPSVEVLADADVLVLPATCDSLEEALQMGGSATIVRRWSKARIKKLIAEGEIEKEAGDALLVEMNKKEDGSQVDKPKKMAETAGIMNVRGIKQAVVYETWTMLMVGEERRLCRAYLGGPVKVLGCKRNPYWSDKCPLISEPVEKIQGSFKGISKIKPCADLQYLANDACNEAMDSAAYALMPIIMTDPEKNPRVGSMVLSLAAVWETSPNDTKFAQFPELWKQGFEIIASAKNEIFQTLSVNPAMITQQQAGAKKKLNQAEIANEQQVDILTTADAVTVVEEGCFSPMLARWIEMDHQYREEDITVAQYGDMGNRANMEKIEPIQFNRRYQFRWFGVEAARNAQQIQQQIAGMNILRSIPPQQLNGYKLNLVPIISQLIENTFGPRLAPMVFESPEMQMPVPVQEENLLLSEGFEVPVHDMDDDNQHIQAHFQALQLAGGKHGKKFQVHIMQHVQQKAKKQAMAQMQMAAQGGQGLPGAPGGAGPGVAGTPRPGAQPRTPRPQGPPGMIHQDQLKSPAMMPRKMA